MGTLCTKHGPVFVGVGTEHHGFVRGRRGLLNFDTLMYITVLHVHVYTQTQISDTYVCMSRVARQGTRPLAARTQRGQTSRHVQCFPHMTFVGAPLLDHKHPCYMSTSPLTTPGRRILLSPPWHWEPVGPWRSAGLCPDDAGNAENAEEGA